MFVDHCDTMMKNETQHGICRLGLCLSCIIDVNAFLDDYHRATMSNKISALEMDS